MSTFLPRSSGSGMVVFVTFMEEDSILDLLSGSKLSNLVFLIIANKEKSSESS